MRIKLADRALPDYTKGEELFNMISHIAGGVFAFAALALCLVKSLSDGDAWAIASSIVYGVSMIILYWTTIIKQDTLGTKVI